MIPWTYAVSKWGSGASSVYQLSFRSPDNVEMGLMLSRREVGRLISILERVLKAKLDDRTGRLDILEEEEG